VIERVVDGDTVYVLASLGLDEYAYRMIRIRGASAHDDQVVEELLAQVGPKPLRVLVSDVYADLAHGLHCARVYLVGGINARTVDSKRSPAR
jgi:hypothetical protein